MDLELIEKFAYVNIDDKKMPIAQNQYDGVERRIVLRRYGHDRRGVIRFELGKEDRRNYQDRRTTPEVWDKGHTLF